MLPTNFVQVKHGGSGTSAQPGQVRSLTEKFSRFARFTSSLTAHPVTFFLAVLAVIIWAACGPATHYSEIWQLWINTSTTILTFLMVFLLQNAQMRDTRALHLKVDELLRAIREARNDLIDVENLSEAELERFGAEFKRLQQQCSTAAQRRGKPRP